MKILVINAGSSSIKFQVFEMPTQKVVCSGLIDRIGLEKGFFKYKTPTLTIEKDINTKDHKTGFEIIVKQLLDIEKGIIQHTDEIEAVGHRVVHGGSFFSNPTTVNKQVKEKIQELFSLAPQHNPANYEGIVFAESVFSKAMQAVVFDTAFHQTMPKESYTYAIPRIFEEKHHIRKYGFHGTSHKYVSKKAIDYLGKEHSKKIISLHLGNGCSITAIHHGKSIDHSMGFSPLSGLVMGTWCGDLDPHIIHHMVNHLNMDLKDVFKQLNKESGMKGLTDGYPDYRDIEQKAAAGNEQCITALNIAAARAKHYIGGFIAKLNGLDAIIFTGGIGENSSYFRELICQKMDYLGIEIDTTKNNLKTTEIQEVQATKSSVKILVIPTNEELEIAKQTYDVINNI
jgi:acetate kinase